MEQMNIEEQGTLDHYLGVYEEVREKVDSVEAAAAIVNQIGEESRLQRSMRGGRSRPSNNGERPATDKQRGFLKALGAKNLAADLTREAASRMIDELQADAE